MKSTIDKLPVLELYRESRHTEYLLAAEPMLSTLSGHEHEIILYYCAQSHKRLGHVQIAMGQFRQVVQNRKAESKYLLSSLFHLGCWSLSIQDYEYSDACLHEYIAISEHNKFTAHIWNLSINAVRARHVDIAAVAEEIAQIQNEKDGLDFFCIALGLLEAPIGLLPILKRDPSRSNTQLFLSTAVLCCLESGDIDAAVTYATRYQDQAKSPFMEIKSEFLFLKIDLHRNANSKAAFIQAQALLTKLRSLPRQLVGDMYESCSKIVAGKTGSQRVLVSRRHGMIGESPGLERVREMIDLYANSDLNILIRGDSGTGKELVAIALHQSSRRRNQGFVPVNCYHLGTQLAEARLFGHRKGAFTGATQDAPGFVHEAHGGTLFLDEVGELPLEAQANLFRFLDSGQFRRVGSTTLEKANVRVIAATNQDLSHDSRFRHELYHRLGTVVIDLPPLAERGNDVLQIARCRVAELNVLNGFNKGLAPEAEKKLLAHNWPGNVRELLNVIDRAWHASSQEIAGDVLRFDRGVPLHMVASLGWAPDLEPDVVDLDESVNRYTARLVHEMLERCNRDTAETARRLNISERTVYRWMKRNDQYSGNGKDMDTSDGPRA